MVITFWTAVRLLVLEPGRAGSSVAGLVNVGGGTELELNVDRAVSAHQ